MHIVLYRRLVEQSRKMTDPRPAFGAAAPSLHRESTLPPDWSATIDPGSGRTYYYHKVTGETSWFPPQPSSNTFGPVVNENMASRTDTRINSQRPDNSQLTSFHPHQQQQQQQQQPYPSIDQSALNNLTSTSSQPQNCDKRPQDVPVNCSTKDSEVELAQYTAGQIADWVYIQRQGRHGSHNNELEPYAVSPIAGTDARYMGQQRPPQEPSRIETRLYALQEQLKRIG